MVKNFTFIFSYNFFDFSLVDSQMLLGHVFFVFFMFCWQKMVFDTIIRFSYGVCVNFQHHKNKDLAFASLYGIICCSLRQDQLITVAALMEIVTAQRYYEQP